VEAATRVHDGRRREFIGVNERSQCHSGSGLVDVGFAYATVKVKEKRTEERSVICGSADGFVFERRKRKVRVNSLRDMALAHCLNIGDSLVERLPDDA